MNRRGFLKGFFAAAAAPAIVRATSLMGIKPLPVPGELLSAIDIYPSNYGTTYAAIGEDLTDVIYHVTPTRTPFLGRVGERAVQIFGDVRTEAQMKALMRRVFELPSYDFELPSYDGDRWPDLDDEISAA